MNTRNYHPIEQAKVTKKQRKPTKKDNKLLDML